MFEIVMGIDDFLIPLVKYWRWSFGDKTSSTNKNPVHTYSKTGKYTVILTVRNAAGSNVVTKSSYITVGPA